MNILEIYFAKVKFAENDAPTHLFARMWEILSVSGKLFNADDIENEEE